MKKCKDWIVEYTYEGMCPYCGLYFDFNNGSDELVKGDEIECEGCEETFTLG